MKFFCKKEYKFRLNFTRHSKLDYDVNMELNYEEKGTGPAVILIHGWGGSHASLENLATELANNGFRTINVDLPGSGSSEPPATPMFMNDYVELLISLIKRLELVRPVMVGHSFGGKIGMFLAVKYQTVLSRLVLIDASGIKPIKTLKNKITYIIAKIANIILWIPPLFLFRPIFRFLYYKLIVREYDYLKSGQMKATFKNVINQHIDENLGKIKNDTLIIWGRDDRYTPLRDGEKIAQGIKNSRLEVVDGVGHSLPLVGPQIVAKLIINFLN